MSTPSDQIAAEVRVELRSILRQNDDLRAPFSWFGLIEGRGEGEPRFAVLFDQGPRRAVQGLRLGGLLTLRRPDERIMDRVFELAKSVWQFKDRLNLWVKAQGLAVDVEAHAAANPDLLVCADLANWKKHGENKNRSGLNPRIETVTFDTSSNGAVEVYHDGASKHQELLVEKDVPIACRVEILGPTKNVLFPDALDLLWQAFRCWLPIIHTVAVLGTDPESEYLRQRLFPVET